MIGVAILLILFVGIYGIISIIMTPVNFKADDLRPRKKEQYPAKSAVFTMKGKRCNYGCMPKGGDNE
jgi:hypothetical protein